MWLRWLSHIILFACFAVSPVYADGEILESDLEYSKGISCYQEKNYLAAIDHFTRCVELDHASEEHIIRNEYSSLWLAHCYFLLGQSEMAEEVSEYYLETPIDKNKTIQIDSIYTLATSYFENKEYESAFPLYQECITLIRSTFGHIHIFYSGIFEEYAFVCEALHRIDDNIEIRKEISEIVCSYYGSTSLEYADALVLLSSEESLAGRFREAITYAQTAAQIYSDRNEIDLRLQTLCKISNYQSFRGLYPEACKTIQVVINESKKSDYVNLPLVIMAMNDYADYLLKLGQISDGIDVCNEAISLCSQGDNALYATTLNVKANLEQARGNYHEAIKLGEEALKIRQSIYGEIHPESALILNNLARYYMEIGQYQYCIELQNKVLSIYEHYFGRKEENYATGLNNLADYYDKSGRTEQSLQIEHEALDLWDSMYGKKHPDYAMALTIIANYYYKTGNIEQAISTIKEALDIKEQLFGKENPDYAISLNNYAYYNSLIGSVNLAIELEKEVLKIYKTVVGELSPDYCMALITLADYYDQDGNIDSTLSCLELSKGLYSKTVGTNNPAYAYCISRLAKAYADSQMIDKAEDFAEEATRVYKDIVLDNFRFLTSYERQQLWGLYENWFSDMLPSIVHQAPTNKMTTVLYDSELLRKGLLLNAELALRDLLAESNDTLMLNVFDELYELKQSLQRQQEQNLLSKESLDSLNMIISSTEKSLIEGSKVYGDYTSNLSTNWINVKSALAKGEIAVEYLRFKDKYNVVQYAALILSSESDYPNYISLCPEDSIMALYNEDKYSNEWGSSFYHKLIQPLTSDSESIHAIFFSPVGMIHNIPIENLAGNIDGHSESLQLFRLSSTRQLIRKNINNERSSASLFGGIAYDSMSTKENGIEELVTQYEIEPIIRGSSLSRSGYDDLPATETEVLTIDGILAQDSIITYLYIHDKATESAFKLMSGQHINILHIATHGFYWTEQDADFRKSVNVLLPIITNKGFEDMSLSRSGLILAGANEVIRDKIKKQGQEDGILTASEIAFLDLRNVDLVVLSACQTGLGEISGEGVFGLQRGFKKAGVHTIVMSLWSVDDEATRLLMEEFYRNLIKGEAQQTALSNAQQYLRTTYSQYQAPHYWAAFVILDSI